MHRDRVESVTCLARSHAYEKQACGAYVGRRCDCKVDGAPSLHSKLNELITAENPKTLYVHTYQTIQLILIRFA